MKIEIDKIEFPWYLPREDINEELLDELMNSLKNDGQWNPIMIRHNGNKYELIAGQRRLTAAKKLGWKEIEVSLLDVTEEKASLLAMTSNLKRSDLSNIEEGKAIDKIMKKNGYTQEQMAKKLGKSIGWINKRLILVLKITKGVQEAIINELISVDKASIISQLSEKRQDRFLDLIISNSWNVKQTREELIRYRNDIIYTIGYSGKSMAQFLDILRKHKIKNVVDIRDSTISLYKPDFSNERLSEELSRKKIEYLKMKEFGVPKYYRDPYIENIIGFECFKALYLWNIKDNWKELGNKLKGIGRSVLLCSEQFPIKKGTQKHNCHRSILAEILQKNKIFEGIKHL